MTTHKTLKAAALAGACLLPLMMAANAQEDPGAVPSVGSSASAWQPTTDTGTFSNEATFGLGGTMGNDASKEKTAPFGRYNGMTNSGPDFFGNFNLNSRDAWNSGATHYFSFTGTDLDFVSNRDNPSIGSGSFGPEAALNLKVGDQGKWGVNAFYSAMTYAASNNFTTILDTDGNLAPSFAGALAKNGAFSANGVSNATLGTLNSYSATRNGAFTANSKYMGPILGSTNEISDVVGTRRDLFGIGGKYQLGGWLFTAAVSDEHKKGSLEDAMTTGGSNTGMIAFALPVDYDTQDYKITGAYHTQSFQAQIYYRLSNFVDHNQGGFGFQGWNFTAVANSPSKGLYTGFEQSGIYAEAPSNQAHTIGGEIGYTLSPSTRLTATAVYSLQLQNDGFVGATQNAYVLGTPALTSELAQNPGSLNGVVNTFFGNVTLTSSPLPKLNLKAAYSIDMRAPETSTMSIWGDATDTTSLKYRIAAPEGWTKQDAVLEAGYKVLSSTRMTVGYAYHQDDRTNAITHRSGDSQESLKLNTTFDPNLTGSLRYAHDVRTASAPDFSLWTAQITSDCVSGGGLGCQQVPFYEAARTEDSVTGNLMGTLAPNLTANLYGKYTANNYHSNAAIYDGVQSPSVGITDDYTATAGPTVSYQYAEGSETHIFYTFIRNYRNMRALSGSNAATGANGYYENTTYDLHSAGIGGTWRATAKVKIGADYIYSYGAQAFNQTGLWNLAENPGVAGDPSLNTQSSNNQVKIHATYDVTPSLQLYLGYQFDSLDMSDYALTGATVGQVLTGDVPAHYNVSTIMTAVKMKW